MGHLLSDILLEASESGMKLTDEYIRAEVTMEQLSAMNKD